MPPKSQPDQGEAFVWDPSTGGPRSLQEPRSWLPEPGEGGLSEETGSGCRG